MSAVRIVMLAVACLAGCVTVDEIDPAPQRGPDMGDDVMLPVVAAAVEPPAQDRASCDAAIDLVPAGDACTVTVTVGFTCDAALPQAHDWARIGVLCDDEPCAYEDVTYACGDELAHTFTVPCAMTFVGGATFDHPRTAADVSCTTN